MTNQAIRDDETLHAAIRSLGEDAEYDLRRVLVETIGDGSLQDYSAVEILRYADLPEARDAANAFLDGVLGAPNGWYVGINTFAADDLERGSGPDRYPTILRDASGRPTDIG